MVKRRANNTTAETVFIVFFVSLYLAMLFGWL